MHGWIRFAFVLCFGLSAIQSLRAQEQAAPPVAVPNVGANAPDKMLAAYVAKPDDSYRTTVRRRWDLGDAHGVELIMQSQTWRDTAWKHQVYVYKPAKLRAGAQAILLIDGGSWKAEYEAAPKEGEELSTNIKTLLAAGDLLECPIVVVKQVPQQPLFNNLFEDGLISYTFAQYIATGDGDWPLLFPMVKSAVRAMDTAQKVAKAEWSLDIDKFLVTGASKRGWTTWLSAVVDSRVNAIAPMVIDTLNMAPQLQQQLAYYGKFSDQLKDYTEKGLPRFMLTPRGRDLIASVDPYSYREQIKQPKLIILGTNDPYWTVDALNLYYDDLVGEKFILYVPNSGHSIKDFPRILGGLSGLYSQVTGGEKMPTLKWEYGDGPKEKFLTIIADPAPAELTIWSADSTTRDFRQATFKSKANAIAPEKREVSSVFKLPNPESGYRAYFVEARYPRKPFDLYLSTQIKIVGGPGDAQKP